MRTKHDYEEEPESSLYDVEDVDYYHPRSRSPNFDEIMMHLQSELTFSSEVVRPPICLHHL
jgi:hypothetical protein